MEFGIKRYIFYLSFNAEFFFVFINNEGGATSNNNKWGRSLCKAIKFFLEIILWAR